MKEDMMLQRHLGVFFRAPDMQVPRIVRIARRSQPHPDAPYRFHAVMLKTQHKAFSFGSRILPYCPSCSEVILHMQLLSCAIRIVSFPAYQIIPLHM